MSGKIRVRVPDALHAAARAPARQPVEAGEGACAEAAVTGAGRGDAPGDRAALVEAAQPEKIILFGSAARGEMGPDSDVDLLVVKSGVHRRELAGAALSSARGSRRFRRTSSSSRPRIWSAIGTRSVSSSGRRCARAEWSMRRLTGPGRHAAELAAPCAKQSGDRQTAEAARGSLGRPLLRCPAGCREGDEGGAGVTRSRLPQDHDLGRLLGSWRVGDAVPGAGVAVSRLTAYARTARYPGSHEPATPEVHRRAIELAEAVMRWAEEAVRGV